MATEAINVIDKIHNLLKLKYMYIVQIQVQTFKVFRNILVYIKICHTVNYLFLFFNKI